MKKLTNGIYAIKPKFQESLRGVEDFLVARNVHPDTITLAALFISIAAGVAFAFAGTHPWVLLFAPVVGFVRTALNALDGMVATRTGIARPWGEVLNEFSDRLADVFLLGGFAFSGLVNIHLVWITVLAAVLSDDIGVLSKAAGGPRQYNGVIGKADRMVLLSVAGLVAYLTHSYWLITAFYALTLIGCVLTIYQRARKTYADL